MSARNYHGDYRAAERFCDLTAGDTGTHMVLWEVIADDAETGDLFVGTEDELADARRDFESRGYEVIVQYENAGGV